MEVTVKQLISCGVSSSKAAVYAPIISQYSGDFGINTPMRMAHFLAQVLHESGCFVYVKELASGAAYDTGKKAQALGNTPKADGDGQKYKGRGLIQVTGTNNYRACGKFFGQDFLTHPELLEKPEWAFKSAGWFWKTAKCNELADKDEFTQITRKINGGTNGLNSRLAFLAKTKKAFGVIK